MIERLVTTGGARSPQSGVLASVVLLGALLAACGAQTTPVPSRVVYMSPSLPTTSASPGLASAQPSTAVTTPSPGASASAGAEAAGGGEAPAAGGEGGAAASYANSRFGYSVDVPGRMTEAADGSASYLSTGETLRIGVLTGSGVADPMATAQADFARAQAERGFKVVAAPATVTIAGRSVVKYVYQSVVGSNPVTGKPYRFTNARYYIPRDGGQLAVVAYAAFTVDFDPQNADDLETSFKWL